MSWLKANRLLAELILLVILAAGFLWYRHSLIAEGESRVTAADATARAAQKVKDQADVDRMAKEATAAAQERDNAQKSLKEYMAAHPTGPVFVCHQNNSGHKSASDPSPNGGAANPSPGFTVMEEVPSGSPEPTADLSPELNAIVLSAGTVANLYRQCQQWPKPVGQ